MLHRLVTNEGEDAMNRGLSVGALALALGSGIAWAQVPPAPQQIAAALLAAPKGLREDATVLGYTSEGTLVVLRKGTGPMICLASNPKEEQFHVACYHRSLEPFMARGRALRRGARRHARHTGPGGDALLAHRSCRKLRPGHRHGAQSGAAIRGLPPE